MWALQGNKLFDKANQTAAEAFASIRTVAAFSLATPMGGLYRSLLAGPSKLGARRAHVNGIGFGYSQFVIFAVYALAFWYGGKLVRSGDLDLEELLKVSPSLLQETSTHLSSSLASCTSCSACASAATCMFRRTLSVPYAFQHWLAELASMPACIVSHPCLGGFLCPDCRTCHALHARYSSRSSSPP